MKNKMKDKIEKYLEGEIDVGELLEQAEGDIILLDGDEFSVVTPPPEAEVENREFGGTIWVDQIVGDTFIIRENISKTRNVSVSKVNRWVEAFEDWMEQNTNLKRFQI